MYFNNFAESRKKRCPDPQNKKKVIVLSSLDERMTSEEELKTNAKEESNCEIINSEGEKIEVKQQSDCGIINAHESVTVAMMIKLLSIIMITQVFQYLYLVNIHLRLIIFLIY